MVYLAQIRRLRSALFAAGLFAALSLVHSAPSAQEKRIVILGDSLAAGYGVEPSEGFPALLQQKIERAELGFEIVNAGVSGDTTAGGVARLNWVLKRPADLLIIELGGNDGLRGISPATTKKNLEKIIDLARSKYPDIRILLAGMRMPPNMGEEYTREFERIFPEVAREKGTALVPFLLEGVGGDKELNQPDRIHPTPEGHRIVAENIWKVLGPMLSGDSSQEKEAAKQGAGL